MAAVLGHRHVLGPDLDASPYTLLHDEIVPLIRLSQLVPGSKVRVRVDANDPTLMAVMWS